MLIKDKVSFDNLFIEQATNGFIVTYYPEHNRTKRELCTDWKDVIKFIQTVEID